MPPTDRAVSLKCTSCAIDGEVIVGAANGLADFDALRSGRQRKDDAAIYAFDLLMLDGEDVRRAPIENRKAKLAKLLHKAAPWLQCADYIDDVDGPIVFEHACKLGCEGIVSKRKGSPYKSGRSRYWIKSENCDSIAVKRESEEDWGTRR